MGHHVFVIPGEPTAARTAITHICRDAWDSKAIVAGRVKVVGSFNSCKPVAIATVSLSWVPTSLCCFWKCDLTAFWWGLMAVSQREHIRSRNGSYNHKFSFVEVSILLFMVTNSWSSIDCSLGSNFALSWLGLTILTLSGSYDLISANEIELL